MNGTDTAKLQREARLALEQRDLRRAHRLCLEILQREADDAEALFISGIIATLNGRWQQGATILERAVSRAPGNPEYRAQLAQAYIHLNRHGEALGEAELAAAANPGDALTMDTLGVVFSRAGDHARATPWFRRAVALAPGNASYHFNLAASLKFLGEFDAAESAYEQAIARQPHYYQAHSALSQLRRQTPAHNHVDRLRQLLERPGLAVDEELHLCHALAKELEDIGDFPAAFASWMRGNRRKRDSAAYDPQDDISLFDAARQAFPADLLQRPADGFDSREPIFVLGMPRTGTTLLERILSSHSTVFAAGELQNFGLAAKRATATPSRRVLDAQTLLASVRLQYRQLGEAYIRSTRPRTGHTPRFIDKLPLNFFYVGLIHLALPRAPIICLRRDPMDTCLSNFRQLFSTTFNYYNYAYDLLDTGRYYLQFDALMDYWDRVLPGRVHTVCYENLVQDPEREARAVMAYCGLDWEPGCLDFHVNQSPVATASSVQVRQPLYSSSIGRWRRYREQLSPLLKLLQAAGVMRGEDWCKRPAPAVPRAG